MFANDSTFLFSSSPSTANLKELQKERNYMGQLAFVHWQEVGQINLMEPLFMPISWTSPAIL